MSGISVKVDMNGARQLRGKVDDLAHAVVSKAAFDVEAGAKDRAAVDTGFMKSSIAVAWENLLQAIVYVGAEYGIYQELGTRKMKAHPFLGPALESVRAGFERAWNEVFKP